MRQGSLGLGTIRRAVGLLLLVYLVLPPAVLGSAARCSMCHGACRCASGASGATCSLRSTSCAGGLPAHVGGAPDAARAVLAGRVSVAACDDAAKLSPVAARIPSSPVRPPLDHPPQISC